MKKQLILIVIIIGVFFAGGCKDEDNPIIPDTTKTVNGSWAGTISTGGTITLNLAQNGNAVTGTGFISAGSFNQACTVPSGTCTDPNVSLLIAIQGFQDISYTGKFTAGNVHSGNLNGSGFYGETITFVKQ